MRSCLNVIVSAIKHINNKKWFMYFFYLYFDIDNHKQLHTQNRLFDIKRYTYIVVVVWVTQYICRYYRLVYMVNQLLLIQFTLKS